MRRLTLLALALLFAISAGDVGNSTENGTALQKPRMVVTFMTNTRIYNQTEGVLNPFQRMIQFFLSNVMRDFAQQPSEERFEPEAMKCSHDEFGFCPACTTRRAQNATEKTIPMSTGKVDNVSTELDVQKQKKRHYFLFISGGTEKRTTANPVGGSSFGSSNVWLDPLINLVRRRRAKDEENTEEAKIEDRDEEETRTPIPKTKSKTVYQPQYRTSFTSSTYFYTVTIPTVLAFGFVIIGMCIVLRTSGRCCKIFVGEMNESEETSTPTPA
ncbi:PREDICTED: uncharacterized protein LOC108558445 [Nicrophorus vespilloides]|uniref:Uncharacterized protein LOC108558445 n=1 Tax=Nicrophorus vespilloides TaxID=110193 RepID=A0ABM1M8E7_NICVS|nr:PREDICTED: uncharacterized protein LOC108558445 [Nicrophorus vespilloides]